MTFSCSAYFLTPVGGLWKYMEEASKIYKKEPITPPYQTCVNKEALNIVQSDPSFLAKSKRGELFQMARNAVALGGKYEFKHG